MPFLAGAPARGRASRGTDGAPGLFRLVPGDHLFHVLFHNVVQHAYARGRIRDLLTIADAATQCAPPELEAVLRRFTVPRDQAIAR